MLVVENWMVFKLFYDEHIFRTLYALQIEVWSPACLHKTKPEASLSSRFVPCHWLCAANLHCSRQQCPPAMSPGAAAECRGADNRVVKTRPAAQPIRSPEPTSVCSCPPTTPWGPGHEEPPVYRSHITVGEWAETRKHLPQDHKCDRGRWRTIQMLGPWVEGWREGSFRPPICWWVQGCSLCRVAHSDKSLTTPKNEIHVLVYIFISYIYKLWNVY